LRASQDDEVDAGTWWAVAYKVLGGGVQFGNDGGFGQFDAPWTPFWT
jgi:hypothetical protein